MQEAACATVESGPPSRLQRRDNPFARFLAAIVFLAASAPTPLWATPDNRVDTDVASRATRRAAFVAELLDEGAGSEALAEAARLRAELPDAAENALAPLLPALALEQGSFEGFATAFLETRDPHVFRVAGCALHQLFQNDPELAASHPELHGQVALCEGSWSSTDQAEATQRLDDAHAAPPAPPTSRGGLGGWFARGVVWFYRTFIGTAIGDRCVLQPSCSRYFLQASRKHGLLGIPMIADRFVREPAASAPDRPWVKTPSGEWRHPDPVEDHDFWFSKAPDSHR